MRTTDALNYLLGEYIGLATRAPKKFPNKPFLAKTQESNMSPITDETLRNLATRLGAKIDGVNS